MREKIAEWLRIQGYFQADGYVKVTPLEMADEILKAISEEIVKVRKENPWRSYTSGNRGWEIACQKILAIFKENKL